jgi:GNAT superfamily N-acetyltransferase
LSNKATLRNKGISLTSLYLELSKKVVDEAIRIELEQGFAKDRSEAIKHVLHRAKVQRSKFRNFRIPAREVTLSEAKAKEKINSVSLIKREKSYKKGKVTVWKRLVTHPTLGNFRQTTFLKKDFSGSSGKIKLTKVGGGDISLVQFEEKMDNRGNSFLYIFNLATAPNYQNIGAASQILSELKYVAKRTGVSKLKLETGMMNEKNINLYKSLGFKVVNSDSIVAEMELKL